MSETPIRNTPGSTLAASIAERVALEFRRKNNSQPESNNIVSRINTIDEVGKNVNQRPLLSPITEDTNSVPSSPLFPNMLQMQAIDQISDPVMPPAPVSSPNKVSALDQAIYLKNISPPLSPISNEVENLNDENKP